MSSSLSSRIFVETTAGIIVARFVDSQIVAEDVVHEVEEQLKELAETHAAADVLLSFHEVQFMSSTVLAMLLRFLRAVKVAGGRLKLCGINPLIMDVFKITRFDRLFEIHAEEWTAIDSFESSSAALQRG
jgi:anti-sigma B factor antagonist